MINLPIEMYNKNFLARFLQFPLCIHQYMQGKQTMTLSRYLMLALFVMGVLSYSSRIDGQYQATTVGATIGAAAGIILSSGTPLGLVGGIVVGGFIGNKMDGSTAENDSVATMRQPKLLNENS
jgi:osmotically inducible lipoprotein OsmB